MPELHPSTWITLFQTLPDPRQQRGCRFPWWVILPIILAALASNHAPPKAMSEWVAAQAATLKPSLWPRWPSESPLRRALRLVDVAA